MQQYHIPEIHFSLVFNVARGSSTLAAAVSRTLPYGCVLLPPPVGSSHALVALHGPEQQSIYR